MSFALRRLCIPNREVGQLYRGEVVTRFDQVADRAHGADLPEGASVCRWGFAFSDKNVAVATERQATSTFRKNLHFRIFYRAASLRSISLRRGTMRKRWCRHGRCDKKAVLPRKHWSV